MSCPDSAANRSRFTSKACSRPVRSVTLGSIWLRCARRALSSSSWLEAAACSSSRLRPRHAAYALPWRPLLARHRPRLAGVRPARVCDRSTPRCGRGVRRFLWRCPAAARPVGSVTPLCGLLRSTRFCGDLMLASQVQFALQRAFAFIEFVEIGMFRCGLPGDAKARLRSSSLS